MRRKPADKKWNIQAPALGFYAIGPFYAPNERAARETIREYLNVKRLPYRSTVYRAPTY